MKNHRIHVLHLVGTARPGGVESFVVNLARHLDSSRFRLSVCIVGCDGPIAEELRSIGTEVCVLGIGEGHKAANALAYYRQLSSGRVDILHTHIGGFFLRFLARTARCRLVLMHVHGPPDDWAENWRSSPGNLKHRMLWAFGWGTDSLIACSHSVAETLCRACPDFLNRVSIVSPGVDLNRFHPKPLKSEETAVLRQELGLLPHAVIIGFVGRLVRQKGLPYLLEAAEWLLCGHSDLQFVVVGDGPLRSALEQSAARLPANRFLFLGERMDVARLMQVFDLVVVPSEWEPFGIVSLESMASARPVVGFDVDGISEVVCNGMTGLLVPHRDTRSLAAAISRLACDADLREQMGRAGRKRAEERFDARVVVQSLESLYNRLSNHVNCPVSA